MSVRDGASPKPCGPFTDTSVAQLAKRLREGTVSALELADAALNAAETTGAALGSFVTLDGEGARSAAENAQKELDAGVDRGPLQGIPIAVKDVIATNGLRTTMGSRHFERYVPRADAEVVTRFRQAGAVIIGKTTTHEFAYGPTGDRGLGGPARNPYDAARMTGGSSGGSAAAVGAGVVPLALGTDTGGSIRIPAALCGVVGLRATTGSISTRGVFPLSRTLDIVGAMARSSDDVELVWNVLSRPLEVMAWSDDVFTVAQAAERDELRLALAERKVRVAVVDCDLTRNVVAAQQQAVADAAERLAEAGVEVMTLAVPELDACGQSYSAIQNPEAYAVHRQRIERAPDLFDDEVLERLRVASQIQGWAYVEALEAQQRLRQAIGERIQGVDVLLLATVPIGAPFVNQRESDLGAGWRNPRDALLALTSPFSLLGWPAITVPVVSGNEKLPASVQLSARPDGENLIMRVAKRLESCAR